MNAKEARERDEENEERSGTIGKVVAEIGQLLK